MSEGTWCGTFCLPMTPTKLVRYTAWIDKKLADELRAISKRTRIPGSALVREAIEYVIKKYGKK